MGEEVKEIKEIIGKGGEIIRFLYATETKNGKDGKIVRFLYATATKDGLVTLDLTREQVSCIGKKSFADDTTLQRIVLPQTLETIEENAFENCKELQIVEMPCSDDVKGAGKEKQPADENTGDEENNNQPAVVEETDQEKQSADKNTGNGGKNNQPAPAKKLTVQYSAFKNCRKLHTVDLSGAQALRIEAEAFADCDSLRTVVLPENCSISENAFTGCRPDILCFVAPKNSGAGEYAREHNYGFVEK